MRVRKSGLGEYFAVLDGGTSIRLGKCSDCGRYILLEHPVMKNFEWVVFKKELDGNRVSSLEWGTYDNGQLICGECLSSNFYDEEYMIEAL